MMLRVCERFGNRPDWFATLDRHEQLKLLAYEEIREAQEAGDFESD